MATNPTTTTTSTRATATIPEQIADGYDALKAITQPVISRWNGLSEPIRNWVYQFPMETIRSKGRNTPRKEGQRYEQSNQLLAGVFFNTLEYNYENGDITEIKRCLDGADKAGQDSLAEMLGKLHIQLLAGQETACLGRDANTVPVATTTSDVAGKVMGLDAAGGNSYVAAGSREELKWINTGVLATSFDYGGSAVRDGSVNVVQPPKAGTWRTLKDEYLVSGCSGLSDVVTKPNAIYLSPIQHHNFGRLLGNATEAFREVTSMDLTDIVMTYHNAFTGGKIPVYPTPNIPTYKSRAATVNSVPLKAEDCTTIYFVDESKLQLGYLIDWGIRTYDSQSDSDSGVMRAVWTWACRHPDSVIYVRDIRETITASSS